MTPGDSVAWADEIEFIVSRLLQANSSDSNETSTIHTVNTTQVLKSSLRVYGSIFLCGFVVYCFLRLRIPRTYAVRQWVPEHKTPLARDQFGYLSWMWKVFSFDQVDLLETISLDALCFLRVLNTGFRLACIGALNSIWLFPVYATAGSSTQDDPVEGSTINILPQGSPRFAATVLAAYIFFGYTMYSILKDFRWFIALRHDWLRRFNCRNYTILIRNIPEELRSDLLLKKHFQELYGVDKVLEAHVCLHISNLDRMIKRRSKCILNLEHALAKLAITGKRPKQMLVLFQDGEDAVRRVKAKPSEVDAIDHYTEELNQLNVQIDDQINLVKRKQRPQLTVSRLVTRLSSRGLGSSLSRNIHQDIDDVHDDTKENFGNATVGEDASEALTDGNDTVSSAAPVSSTSACRTSVVKSAISHTPGVVSNLATNAASTAKGAGKAMKQKAIKNTKKKIKQTMHSVNAVSDTVASALFKEEDGTADDAGFVTFTSLVATHSALQMSQHPEPFVLDTIAAPDEPQHIFWDNVGKSKEALQSGRLISAGVTAGICLFWTFIVSFIVNLTNVNYLRNEFPSMNQTLLENPWIGTILSILSPMLLLILNSALLPIVLKTVSRLEFPASDALLEASAFWKMATFTIVQTFFVSLISGSLIQELEILAENPEELIHILARSLPGQSGYFMQLLIVSTCFGSLIELFRVVPLVQSVLRANLGQRLTQKERNRSVGILRPLSNIDKIYFSRVQSRYLLYFMVMFVYSMISPLVNWFCVFLFLFASCVYRYQFVFNYPNTPDSGGEVWLYFVRVILACIVIAQLTLVGFLALKGSAVGVSLMVPLVVVTVLFIIYLSSCYFKIGKYLPARTCLSQDMANADDGVEYDEFKKKYQNPALTARFMDADWDSGKSMSSRPPTMLALEAATEKPVNDENYDGFVNNDEEYGTENQVVSDKDNNAEVKMDKSTSQVDSEAKV